MSPHKAHCFDLARTMLLLLTGAESHDPIGQHGVGYFHEAADVGSLDVVHKAVRPREKTRTRAVVGGVTRGNFSSMRVNPREPAAACPPNLTRWGMPRRDLFFAD